MNNENNSNENLHGNTGLAILVMNSFYNIGHEMYNKYEINFKDLKCLKYLIPACMNLCLSIELAFKIIRNRIDQEYQKIHKIDILFNDLPVEIKKFVEKGLEKVGFTQEESKKNITNISNMFVELRYLGFDNVESFNIDFKFIYFLATISKNLVNKMSPSTNQWLKENKIL